MALAMNIEELLFLAITKAKIQLRKYKQKKRRENSLRFPPNFPLYYKLGQQYLPRSKEIHGVAIFKKSLIRDLIYIIGDEDFWQDYSAGFLHKKNLAPIDQNFDFQYLFDEKIDIAYTNGSYAERSILVRTIYLLCGENPYASEIQNNINIKSADLVEKVNARSKAKIFFELRKLKSNFLNVKELMSFELSMNIERWDGTYTNHELFWSLDKMIILLEDIEKTLFGMFVLWNAISGELYQDEIVSEQEFIKEREKLEIYRQSEELSWSEYDLTNIQTLHYLCRDYSIEMEFVVDIWGGSLKAFYAEQNKNKNEDKKVIRVFKALKSNEIDLITQTFIKKGHAEEEIKSIMDWFKCVKKNLVTVSSAIAFLESKKINCKLKYKNRKQDCSYKYIQYLEENYLSEEKTKSPYASMKDANKVIMDKKELVQILCN